MIYERQMAAMIPRKPVPFPCDALPADPAAARLAGLYPQRQAGRWMQRVKVLGGELSPAQWRALAGVARDLAPGEPLHLTTRQDVEIHGLGAEGVPAAQRRLAEAGLIGAGACGDAVRNLTVCPCSGSLAGRIDLRPHARRIAGLFQDAKGVVTLPRKFKISLSCSDACGQPWINDLGLVFERRDGRDGFRVIGAGSLGPRPATGIVLFDWLPACDAPAAALAAVRIFETRGERQNRSRARLRHLRERLGDEEFLALLASSLEEARRENALPYAALSGAEGELTAAATLTFPDGDVRPEDADALASLAERDELRVRIGNHHQVVVFGRQESDLRQAVKDPSPLARRAEAQATVVACPGTRWCSRAVTDTAGLAARIRSGLAGRAPRLAVCISGCPNGCAHSAVADIGLVGMRAGGRGGEEDAYDVLAGGGMGRDGRLAGVAARRLPAGQAVGEVLRRAAECP